MIFPSARAARHDASCTKALCWLAISAAVLLVPVAPSQARPLQLAAVAPDSPGAAEQKAAVPDVPVASAVRLVSTGDTTRLVFDLSGPVEATAYPLAQPDRIIVDLPEVNFQVDPEVGRPAEAAKPPARHRRGRRARARARIGTPPPALAGSVRSFRFGLFAPGKSRIVVDLTEPARILRAKTEADSSGRLHFVIELVRSERAAFNAAASAAARAAPLAPPPADKADVPPEGSRPLVVLDAGHGGVDTGALGSSGIVEKEITFAFAASLKARLEAAGRYRVLLTRPADVFVPLGERVRIARKAGAALFISIHADTLADAANVAGATVYTAAERASDSEAARVADSENQADAAAGLDNADEKDDISDILADLTRRETRAYSHVLARSIVSYWHSVGRLNKNPQRSAGFVVLKAPDVPSVLLELGYLSNPGDATALTSNEWRERAAGSVEKSIDTFFSARLAPRQPEPEGPVAGLDTAKPLRR